MPPTHRRPNFVAFIATGAILGFVAGSAVGYYGGDQPAGGPDYGATSAVLFLGVGAAFLFGLVAAVVAVLLDRRD